MWTPQPGPQTAAILTARFIDELLFGGARGGGKSDFLLGDFGQDVGKGYGDAWRGVMLRRTYPELEELIARSRSIYQTWFPGCTWNEQQKTWRFPDGATLKMRYLEREQDADRYQGHQYTWIGWDELCNWNTLAGYHKLKATLRSAHGVEGLRIRCSANPGGPGHQAVKQYFGIDVSPHGNAIIDDPDTGMKRMFIRSKVQDNRILLDHDPGYIGRLKGTGSVEQVRAWLDGDWDVVLGAFFDCWRTQLHVVRPFTMPSHWMRFRSVDWGSYRPFSVGWWAVASEELAVIDGHVIPRGSLVRYREWYGAKEPNIGLKLTAEEVANGILARTPKNEHIAYTVSDPSMFREDGGPSLSERFSKCKVILRPGDNTRISTKGAMGGWDQMRARLIGEDGRPTIYFFSTCPDAIRTIPALQHDLDKPEDVDSDSEDHAADETRYACMSRPYVKARPASDRPITAQPSFDEMLKRHRKQKQREADNPWG